MRSRRRCVLSVAGASLLLLALPRQLSAAQLASYESAEGLLVAKVAAVSRGAQPLSPEEPPSSCSGGCGCGAGKAVRVTLVTGRTLTLQGLPEEAPRYRLAERPPRPILAETPPGTVMDALVESPLLAYEPATQTLLFAASPQAGPLEGLLFHVKAAEGDVWTIEDGEEAPPVLSPKVLEVVRQIVGQPVAEPALTARAAPGVGVEPQAAGAHDLGKTGWMVKPPLRPGSASIPFGSAPSLEMLDYCVSYPGFPTSRQPGMEAWETVESISGTWVMFKNRPAARDFANVKEILLLQYRKGDPEDHLTVPLPYEVREVLPRLQPGDELMPQWGQNRIVRVILRCDGQ